MTSKFKHFVLTPKKEMICLLNGRLLIKMTVKKSASLELITDSELEVL